MAWRSTLLIFKKGVCQLAIITLERCEVLALSDKPMELKFTRKKNIGSQISLRILESKQHPTALNKPELTQNFFVSFIGSNSLSPNIHIQILQTGLQTFS